MKQIKSWEIWGAVITILIGSILHFVYGWSDGSKIVAFFGAVNESTWEHLKLAFWPTFIFTLIEWVRFRKDLKNFCFASFIKIISMPIIIIGLFYLWLAFFKDNFIYDISIFVVAVIVGYYLSYRIMISDKKFGPTILWQVLILIVLLKFSFFTFFPPKIFLFKDPIGGNYGIDKLWSSKEFKTYTYKGITFQYPKEFTDINLSGDYIDISKEYNKNGILINDGITVQITNKGFNPKLIMTPVGIVEEAQKKTIGNKDFYAYSLGDAGFRSYVYNYIISKNSYLKIQFNTTVDSRWDIAKDLKHILENIVIDVNQSKYLSDKYFCEQDSDCVGICGSSINKFYNKKYPIDITTTACPQIIINENKCESNKCKAILDENSPI